MPAMSRVEHVRGGADDARQGSRSGSPARITRTIGRHSTCLRRMRFLMQRRAWACLLAAVMACGEPDSPTSPSTTTAGAALSTLEVDPSVLSGQAARATVTLSAPASANGVAISVTASGTSATVPPSVTVPAGATTATFDVATARVSITTDVTITAQAGGVTRTDSLRLRIDPTDLRPSVNYTIGFAGLRDNRASVPTY